MDYHYPATRSPLLAWLPRRCCCGRYRCASMITQERARRRFRETMWTEAPVTEEWYQQMRREDHGGWGRR